MFIYVNRIWLSKWEKTLLTPAMLWFYLSGTQSQETFKKRFGTSVSNPGMMLFFFFFPYITMCVLNEYQSMVTNEFTH